MLVTSADERKAAGSRSGAAGSRGVDAALALETGAVERNLARIFHTKSKVFGSSVPFTQVWAARGEGKGAATAGLMFLQRCCRELVAYGTPCTRA